MNRQVKTHFPMTENAAVVFGWKKEILFFVMALNLYWIALTAYRNPLTALKVLKIFAHNERLTRGDYKILKCVTAGGRYFWSLDVPGWPSLSFNSFYENEFNKIRPFRSDNGHLPIIIFAVTKKCPLQCGHCFEWPNLSDRESLSLDDLKGVLRGFQERGVAQVQLSGGEPLCRFEDTLELIEFAKRGTDFWLLTSGYGLTLDKAARLKKAGLTGVHIGLDHWSEEYHNLCRNNKLSFYWVKEAAANSREVDLAVCFSLCARKDFITLGNLWKYVYLAKEWGAGFIRILEPRGVGRFEDKDVELDEECIEILKYFYLKVNSNPVRRELPILMYPGYHQRRVGCFGAGNKYLYVDPNGDLHACPFCRRTVGNALVDSVDSAVLEMRKIGCHKFETVSNF